MKLKKIDLLFTWVLAIFLCTPILSTSQQDAARTQLALDATNNSESAQALVASETASNINGYIFIFGLVTISSTYIVIRRRS